MMELSTNRRTAGGVLIRPYRTDDYAVLRAILIEAFDGVSIDHAVESELGRIAGYDWRWRKGRDLMTDVERDVEGVLVAEVDGRPVGFVSTWQDVEAGIGYIPNLAVVAECRGMGIGRRLIETAIERFRSSGLSAVRIETLQQNERANGLYTSEGFVEVARQVHFVRDIRSVNVTGNGSANGNGHKPS